MKPILLLLTAAALLAGCVKTPDSVETATTDANATLPSAGAPAGAAGAAAAAAAAVPVAFAYDGKVPIYAEAVS
ncbi:MAG TPA: hypothetical protein VNX21_07995, partial [Candidatus Thermoplasmatota archaeon]|nr:hypothetical protein [Candidatus Thermoplasmatota archaeon]